MAPKRPETGPRRQVQRSRDSIRTAGEDILAAATPRKLEDSVLVSVPLELTPLAIDALGAGTHDAKRIARRLDIVLRYFLSAIGGGRVGRRYPIDLEEPGSATGSELVVSLDNRVWRAFEEEAERQGVPAAKLVSHAVFYFAADADSGEITARILAELQSEED